MLQHIGILSFFYFVAILKTIQNMGPKILSVNIVIQSGGIMNTIIPLQKSP